MTKTYQQTAKEKFEKLKQATSVKILAVESSCDETSVAIVENGRTIFSNIIATQIEIHKRFGGVVPEIASRNHVMAIKNVCEEAILKAGLTLNDIDAIAVTYGAGLIGALLVGVNFAKALAYSLNLPLLAVSHIHGHIASNYISHKTLTPPFLCLMVSGGHTAILDVKSYTNFKLIATTVDDAVGEAFDKVARVLSLGYPGGPKIDKLAKEGKNNIIFKTRNSLKDSLNFSFSGIKTAVINYIHKEEQAKNPIVTEDVCASFQTLVVDELCTKAIRALKEVGYNKLVVAGGVAANSFLKQRLNELSSLNNFELYMPELYLCTDNAAMIASAAYFNLLDNIGLSELNLNAKSTVAL